MKSILFFWLLLFSINNFSQTTISGKIIDKKGNAIEGANIYLEGTYDGTSSLQNGTFSFSTSEKGVKTLVVSFISFETFYKVLDVSKMKKLVIKLRENVNTLDAVEINAGSFEAGDNAKKVTALKPIDIYTTASAMGDVFGAFQTLPGTATNEEDGRLFVRGGDADETQIYIDGIHVANPFLASGNNIATRGRFSPMLFKGMNFSTGGYSAEYGQALSGVLTMNTIDEPTQEKTDLGFLSVGLAAGNTQIWGENSFSINASYINLAPYQWAFPDRDKWLKPYESGSGEMIFRHKPNENGLLKLYGSFSVSDLDVVQENINFSNGFNFGIKNRNLYFNGSYKESLKNSWTILGGLSYTNDKTNIKFQLNKIESTKNSAHAKVKLHKRFSNRFKINFGTEYYMNNYKEDFFNNATDKFNAKVANNIFGSFVETDIFFSKKLAAKIGVRAENSELLNEFTISPRISLAYKTGKNAQFSLAYGQFYQNPKNKVLKFSKNISSENATHFIANYQLTRKQQIFRVEGYLKEYNHLIKYNHQFVNYKTIFNNDGNGYAKGIDVFWRDGKSIKFLEYWLSYSFLDTQRNYKNYPIKAQPNFASKHNMSLVTKYWINDWQTSLGMVYNFASGRTYTNPNRNGFLNQKTKNYNSLSVSVSHLITQQKILYFSVNNVLGTKNIYGYRYKNQPNTNGFYERQAIEPSANTFFVVGFFWTISTDKKSNQLKNL